MIVRKAIESDLIEIIQIYKNAVQCMNTNGILQWDDIYPTEDILKTDVEQNTMYLCIIEDAIAAVFVLNQKYDHEYESGHWQYKQASFSVVHRLCVNPAFQGKGVGFQAMITAESILRKNGTDAVRLDAFSQNPAALSLYKKLSYTKVGAVQFRKGLFFLFEKKL